MYINNKGHHCIEANNDDLINYYIECRNIYKVAEKYKCNPVTVFNRVQKAGISTKRNKIKFTRTDDKFCTKCKTMKSISEFHKDNTHIDGFRTHCKVCIKDIQTNTRKKISLVEKKRLDSDINFKLIKLLRNRIKQSIKRNNKSTHTKELIGCTIEELKEHLQQTAVTNGYTNFDINNYSGENYHIDHIVPCVAFNLKCGFHQKICFNYKNLQILTANENILKGAYLA